MLLLRAFVAIGGLTFIATGVGIFWRETCQSVTWGSRGREHAGNFTATCHDTVVNGGMSQGVAGLIAVAAGLAIVLVVMLPSLRLNLARRFR
ncbi:MAG: hypothetical protein ABFR53_08810 [Actinomycetota bacterium]